MKTKLLLCLSAVLLSFTKIPSETFETARNIYIGDIINLEIGSGDIFSEEIREKFKDFEIVELIKKPNGYLISIRTFEPGIYTVYLKDKEISINVKSVLDDISREGIYEGGTQVTAPGLIFYWRILFYIAAGVFVLACVFMLSKIFLKKKNEKSEPYQLFIRCSASLELESENYFVDLTRFFKEYIGSLYQKKIIGKTSSEILSELREIQFPENMLFDVGMWLAECDRLKFTGIKASAEKKKEHCGILLDLAKIINLRQEEEKKEGAA